MLAFIWDKKGDLEIGKSTCNKYVIEIFKEKENYGYFIKKNGQTLYVSNNTHENIEKAKKNAISLISIRYVLI